MNIVKTGEHYTATLSSDGKVINIKADDGWAFRKNKGIMIEIHGDMDYKNDFDDYATSYNYTIPSKHLNATTVEIRAYPEEHTTQPPLPTYYNVLGTHNNVTITPNPFTEDVEEFHLKADDGFVFSKNGSVQWDIFDSTITVSGGETEIILKVPEDEKPLKQNIRITISVIPHTVVVVSEYIQIFNVLDSELRALIPNMYTYNTGGGSGDSSVTKVDLSPFLTNLYLLPIVIPDSFMTKDQEIHLGGINTRIKSTMVSNYIHKFDLGKITVPEVTKDSYDYDDVSCILNVPFYKPIPLDSFYCINQTLTITFVVDLYSGSCNILIHSSFNDNVIENVKFNLGSTIPYVSTSSPSKLLSSTNSI